MLALKLVFKMVGLPAALVCLGAAGATDSEKPAGLQAPPSRMARMQCRIYFGCLPADRLPSPHPLSNGQE